MCLVPPVQGGVAQAGTQMLRELLPEPTAAPAHVHRLTVTLVGGQEVQPRRGIGPMPRHSQALHGPHVEEAISGDPFPLLGWGSGVAALGQSHQRVLGLQAALHARVVDEKDSGVWRENKWKG